MRFRLRTLMIVLAILPPLLAAAYFTPRLAFAFLVLLACAGVADWLARRMAFGLWFVLPKTWFELLNK